MNFVGSGVGDVRENEQRFIIFKMPGKAGKVGMSQGRGKGGKGGKGGKCGFGKGKGYNRGYGKSRAHKKLRNEIDGIT